MPTSRIELALVDRFIDQTLRNDATIQGLAGTAGNADSVRCYHDLAPVDAVFPLVVFSEQSNFDIRGVGSERIAGSALYLVKAIGLIESYVPVLLPLAERIDALLHRASGAVPGGGTVIGSVRESVFKLTEQTGGVQVRHLGGSYRIMAQE